MSVFDIFRNAVNLGNKQSQGLDPNQNPNLNPNVSANPNPGNPNPANPNPQPNVVNDNAKEPPVDPFKDLWTIDPKQKGPVDLAEFSFQFDPKKVDASVGALDFTKAITPEILAKIQAGGPEAISATLQAMNIVGQQAAKTALIGAAQVTENGIRTNGQRLKDNLPSLVRNESVSNAMREDNPLFNDPSTAPMMELVTQQLAQKFPSSSPAEIRESAKQYMLNLATSAAKFGGNKVITDAPNPAANNPRGHQTDWSAEPI